MSLWEQIPEEPDLALGYIYGTLFPFGVKNGHEKGPEQVALDLILLQIWRGLLLHSLIT